MSDDKLCYQSNGYIHCIQTLPTIKDASKRDEPIKLEPTFAGNEYYDASMYMKFNNAIERMTKPREVEHTEVDVEFVCRNEYGSIYAVAVHFEDGTTDSDMLTKTKAGGWWFRRTQFRYHPNFISAYISSIWGYKKISELQVAKEICDSQYIIRCCTFVCEKFVFRFYPGGIAIVRCKIDGESIIPYEVIDFVPYEQLKKEDISAAYSEIIQRYATMGELDDEISLPDTLLTQILEISLAKMKKKYGEKLRK